MSQNLTISVEIPPTSCEMMNLIAATTTRLSGTAFTDWNDW